MKKIISISTAIIIAAVLSVSIFAESVPFSDVAPDHWASDNITKIASLGYFSGYEDGTFRPDNQITHEEFTKIIVDVANIDITPFQDDYTATNASLKAIWADWAQPYLNAALTANIITNKDTDLIAPNTPITRQEMAKIISNLLLYLGYESIIDADLSNMITDYNLIDSKYISAVGECYTAKILTGYDDNSFKPAGNLTRAEASTVIMRLLDYIKNTTVLTITPAV